MDGTSALLSGSSTFRATRFYIIIIVILITTIIIIMIAIIIILLNFVNFSLRL